MSAKELYLMLERGQLKPDRRVLRMSVINQRKSRQLSERIVALARYSVPADQSEIVRKMRAEIALVRANRDLRLLL